MKQRLFVTLSLAGLAMATFGATKPKTAIKSLNKTTIQQPHRMARPSGECHQSFSVAHQFLHLSGR